MEASIQEVARLTGTTSRTLRHYDAIGLLAAQPRRRRTGTAGTTTRALVRLQRILLLRGLGLGPAGHRARARPRAGRDRRAAPPPRLAAQRAATAGRGRSPSVERTITARENGGPLMAEEMFDGFDHTQHKEEVERRWGADAYATSDAWWRGMTDDERAAWKATTAQLATEWGAAAAAGHRPGVRRGAGPRPAARRLARQHPRHARARHAVRSTGRPGRDVRGRPAVRDYGGGLAGRMYVAAGPAVRARTTAATARARRSSATRLHAVRGAARC